MKKVYGRASCETANIQFGLARTICLMLKLGAYAMHFLVKRLRKCFFKQLKLQELKLCNFLGIMIIMSLLLGSCATKKIIDESKRTEMYVMVYDYENKGLQDAAVIIDRKEIGRTDVYGRYVLSLKEGERYFIQIEKKEYEVMERDFIFNSMHVLYFQIGNASQLLRLAEKAMDQSEYLNAVKLLERSIRLDGSRIDAKYLQAIGYYHLGMYEETKVLLETLIGQVKNKKVVEDLREQVLQLNELVE